MSVSLVYSLLIWACSSVQPTSCPWCPPLRKSSPSCRPLKIECSLWYVGGGKSWLKGISTCFECFQQFSCLCIKLSHTNMYFGTSYYLSYLINDSSFPCTLHLILSCWEYDLYLLKLPDTFSLAPTTHQWFSVTRHFHMKGHSILLSPCHNYSIQYTN